MMLPSLSTQTQSLSDSKKVVPCKDDNLREGSSSAKSSQKSPQHCKRYQGWIQYPSATTGNFIACSVPDFVTPPSDVITRARGVNNRPSFCAGASVPS
ncbi:unnamed protein product [Cylicocyclus nassatus]|uniref:Uncharacterized protein n=1 Tax=Cylicocyclus nassatus TaxID=53992 RepID=A0AA36GRH3_CYLNA|nr:unnamed protein product [Cylicocyclus nassatus]